jgi:hypothetical protein
VTADQEFRRIRHRAEIGSDIDRIRDEQQGYDHSQQPSRIMTAQISCDAMARRASDARADLLDRCHQRVGQQHGPADLEAELRPGLAIGADSGGIVVGSARDQARPEHSEKAPKVAPCSVVLELAIGLAPADRTCSGARARDACCSSTERGRRCRFVTNCGTFLPPPEACVTSSSRHQSASWQPVVPSAVGRRDRPPPS